jgi:hypothetical protein
MSLDISVGILNPPIPFTCMSYIGWVGICCTAFCVPRLVTHPLLSSKKQWKENRSHVSFFIIEVMRGFSADISKQFALVLSIRIANR